MTRKSLTSLIVFLGMGFQLSGCASFSPNTTAANGGVNGAEATEEESNGRKSGKFDGPSDRFVQVGSGGTTGASRIK